MVTDHSAMISYGSPKYLGDPLNISLQDLHVFSDRGFPLSEQDISIRNIEIYRCTLLDG